MKIEIKRIVLKDLGKFYEFFKKTVKKEFPIYTKGDLNYIFTQGWSKQTYEYWIKNNSRFILAAYNDNKIIGILDAERPFLGVFFCSWIMVNSKFQRNGVGTKLLKEFEKVALKNGVHMLYLYADKKNIPYYKKIGYEHVGNMKKSWFGQDHYILTKLLQKPKEKNYLKKVKL